MDDAESNSSKWQDLVPLDAITTHLPSHYQHGLQTSPLVLTGVTSFEDHLILSTNVGLIFLAHLPSLQVVRLKCERSLSRMTCVSAMRSVDDMIAAGSADGCISVFLLPRLLAPVHAAPRAGLGQDLKRFSVSSLHAAPITSLAWSSNGLRLVSADAAGTVGLLEVDHDCCQCIARHLFSEGGPVTQLSYWKQKVAASTEERCVVYSLQTEELSTVGMKPRKQKGRFGVSWSRRGLKDSVAGASESSASSTAGASPDDVSAASGEAKANDLSRITSETSRDASKVAVNEGVKQSVENLPEHSESGCCLDPTARSLSSDSGQPRATVTRQLSSAMEDSVLYTSRPGQRVWVAHDSGLVQTTLLIKDLPAGVRIYVPGVKNEDKVPSIIKFENIQVLDTGQLVIHSDDSLVIFNPMTLLVEAFLHNENFIRDVSFTKSTIFILSKTGKAFCLSCEPLNIGSSAILRSVHETKAATRSSALLSPATLKKFGRKMYTQSSSVLDSVVKLGGTIASRVSETASRDTIITGISEQEFVWGKDLALERNSSSLADKGFFSSYHLSGSELNSATKQSLVPCSLTQSVSGTLPASHLPESPDAEDPRMTQSLCNFLEPSQLKNDEVQEEGLLVVRGTPGKRKQKRQLRSSPDPENSSKSPTQRDALESDTTSPLDGAAVTEATAQASAFSVEETERRLGEMLGIECLKNSSAVHNSQQDQRLNTGSNTLSNSDVQNVLSSDNRVSEGLKADGVGQNVITSVEQTVEASCSDQQCNFSNTGNIARERNRAVRLMNEEFTKEGHNSSELLTLLCSQDASSSLESIASELCYGPPSGSSVPSIHSLLSTHIVGALDAGPLERVDQDSLEDSGRRGYDDPENFRDVHLEGYGEGQDGSVTPQPDVVLTLNSHGMSSVTSLPDNVVDGEWRTLFLPSGVRLLGDSDEHLVYLDDSGDRLFFGKVEDCSKQCSWARMCLPFSVSFFSVSGSGNSIYLVAGGSLYVCRRSSLTEVNSNELRSNPVNDLSSSDVSSHESPTNVILETSVGAEGRADHLPAEDTCNTQSSRDVEDSRDCQKAGASKMDSIPSIECFSQRKSDESAMPEKPAEDLTANTEDCENSNAGSTGETSCRDHALLRRTDGVVGDSRTDATRPDQRHNALSSEVLSSFVMWPRPVAKHVSAAAGDDQVVFFITDDGKVWCLLFSASGAQGAAGGGRAVSLPCEERTEFVSLAYRDGLLWALDVNGKIFFRAGQSVECPMGLSWGVMLSDEDFEASQPDPGISLDSFCVVDSQGRSGNEPSSSLRFLHEESPRNPSNPKNLNRNSQNNNSKICSQSDVGGNVNRFNSNNNNDDYTKNLSVPNRRQSENDQLVSVSSTPEMRSIFMDTVASTGISAQPSGSDAGSRSSNINYYQSLCSEKSSVVSVTISGGEVGWRVTACGDVAFRPGVSPSIPQGANTKWWHVARGRREMTCGNRPTRKRGSWRKTVDSQAGNSSENDSDSEESTARTMISSNTSFLWLSHPGDRFALMHPVAVTGSVWSPAGSDRWSTISAEALFAHHGALACLSPTGGLYLIDPTSLVPTEVPLPDISPAVCVAQRPETLWLLSASGDLWIRGDVSSSCVVGTHWQRLDLTQISDVHLRHVSLGMEVAWAVDTQGGVYMRQGSLSPPHPNACPQAWLQVDRHPLPHGAIFTKVFVGPDRHLVWATDSRHCVYVRVAIFSDLPIGVDWEPVTGIRALNMTISETGRVFAVTEEGEVYERRGVDPPSNYIGSSWHKLPGTLASVSVSVDGELWGLTQCGELCRRLPMHSLQWRPTASSPSACDRHRRLLHQDSTVESEPESGQASVDESWEMLS